MATRSSDIVWCDPSHYIVTPLPGLPRPRHDLSTYILEMLDVEDFVMVEMANSGVNTMSLSADCVAMKTGVGRRCRFSNLCVLARWNVRLA